MKSALCFLTASLIYITTLSAAPIADSETSNSLHHLDKRQCVYQRAFYDDNVAFKEPGTYVGAWTHLTNQGSTVKEGTLSYTGEANAMVYLPDPFPPGTFTANVTVWSTMKNDRGKFNVYVGTTLLGTGNQYTSATQETSTQRVFHRINAQIQGGYYFAIKNDKGAPFMAFDALEIEYCKFW